MVARAVARAAAATAEGGRVRVATAVAGWETTEVVAHLAAAAAAASATVAVAVVGGPVAVAAEGWEELWVVGLAMQRRSSTRRQTFH